MKRKNKWTYYRVIQTFNSGEWCDDDWYEVKSTYAFRSLEERKLFTENLKAYRETHQGGVRVIRKKELTV